MHNSSGQAPHVTLSLGYHMGMVLAVPCIQYRANDIAVLRTVSTKALPLSIQSHATSKLSIITSIHGTTHNVARCGPSSPGTPTNERQCTGPPNQPNTHDGSGSDSDDAS